MAMEDDFSQRNIMLPPFLQKLNSIARNCPADIGTWSKDGRAFTVKDEERFGEFLKNHFKGNLQTFVRQLHFYGFKKVDVHQGSWSFVHEKFQKNKPELLSEIKRKTRTETNQSAPASKGELQALRSQVAQLEDVIQDLQLKLTTVLSVLKENNSEAINSIINEKEETASKTTSITSLKRPRRYSTDSSFETHSTEDDKSSMNDGVDVYSQMEPLPELTDINSLFSEDDHLREFFTHDTIVAMDSGMADTMSDDGDMMLRENQLSVSDGEEVSSTPEQTMLPNTEAVAFATKVDPQTVSKVLGYLRASIAEKSLRSTIDFPQSMTLLRSVSLPTQEVGAN